MSGWSEAPYDVLALARDDNGTQRYNAVYPTTMSLALARALQQVPQVPTGHTVSDSRPHGAMLCGTQRGVNPRRSAHCPAVGCSHAPTKPSYSTCKISLAGRERHQLRYCPRSPVHSPNSQASLPAVHSWCSLLQGNRLGSSNAHIASERNLDVHLRHTVPSVFKPATLVSPHMPRAAGPASRNTTLSVDRDDSGSLSGASCPFPAT